MTSGLQGQCLCGDVHFRVNGDPAAFVQCYCRSCQRLAGGNAAAILLVSDAAFALERGELADYVSQSDRGNTISRRFCARCGTQVYSRSSGSPGTLYLKAGTIDTWPAELSPQMNLWLDSARPWMQVDHSVPGMGAQP